MLSSREIANTLFHLARFLSVHPLFVYYERNQNVILPYRLIEEKQPREKIFQSLQTAFLSFCQFVLKCL